LGPLQPGLACLNLAAADSIHHDQQAHLGDDILVLRRH
jgi:hypothetical protein